MAKKVERFGLRETMTNDEVVAELRGRVSGETAQEIAPFFAAPTKGLEWQGSAPERAVIESDGEHALLARMETVNDPILGRFPVSQVRYWLSGITDEGSYFLHPILERPVMTNGAPVGDLDSILAWANRVDQGFSGRLQGDILLAFHAHPVINTGNGPAVRPRWTPDVAVRDSPPQRMWSGSWQDRGYVLTAGNRFGNSDRLDADPSRALKSVSMGNHRISTDGWMFVSASHGMSSTGFVVVDGDTVILQHPEHARVERSIPKDHYAVLAPQRGRTITVDGGGVRGAD